MGDLTPEEIADRCEQIDRELAKASGVITASDGRRIVQLIAQLARAVAQSGRRS